MVQESGYGSQAGIDRLRQQTLKNPIRCAGVGLHTGERVNMTLRPAEPDSGIRFRRTDEAGRGLELPALWQHAIETPLCTTLVSDDGIRIATIEHLMAALLACDIDNALIELEGEEVPILDGSAAPFVFLIECAGRKTQDAPRKAIRLLQRVEVKDPDRHATLAPGSGFSIDLMIDFESAAIAHQRWHGSLDEETFKREIARARTFGFLEEVDRMRAMGLARGGSLDNAIVISGDRVVNPGGLRYRDEFVRHKVLDSIGDLFLAGAPLLGSFSAERTGHALNLRLLQALFADDEAWEWTTLREADLLNVPRGVGSAAALERAVAARA